MSKKQTKKRQRLTVGMRARILPSKKSTWGSCYGDREVLLLERSSNSFSVMVLKKGTGIRLLREDGSVVTDQIAWVNEEEMEFVDANFEENLDFIDWYQENEDCFCPDCGYWFPDNGKCDVTCPNKDCPGTTTNTIERGGQ